MKNTYNIAILVDCLSAGGAQKVAGNLSCCLSKWYQVYIFIIDDENITYDYKGVIVKIDSQNLYEAVLLNKKNYKIDCAISFSMALNIINVRTKRRETVIVTHHNSTDIKTTNIPLIQKYYGASDRVVACSEGVRRLLVTNGGLDEDKVVAIRNLVGISSVSGSQELPDDIKMFLDGKEYLLNVGRLTWEKNQAWLIRQFEFFACNYDNEKKLLIIGNGDLKSELLRLIHDLGMDDRIAIFPFTEDISVLYKHAKILVSSSVTEGLSNVILEAMAFGLPVVSTDIYSGPREILNDEYDYDKLTKEYRIVKRGILVGGGSSEKGRSHFFADAIRDILSNAEKFEAIHRNCLNYWEQLPESRDVELWKQQIQILSIVKNPLLLEEEQYDKALINYDTVIIYGAGSSGRKTLSILDRKKKIYFAVSEKNKEERIDDIPVKVISDLIRFKENAVVLIATYKERYYSEMYRKAVECGFLHIFYSRY